MILRRFLSRLLALANARPPVYRTEFYALKDALLRRYGRLVGQDVQHIVDDCWGFYEDDGCPGARCSKCGGTGVWGERWIRLERWDLAGRIFHRPAGYLFQAVATIEGRITHEPVDHRAAADAALWLTLFFDPPTWWRWFRSSRHCGWQWRPMLALQAIVFEIRLRLMPSRCSVCRHRYWRGARQGWIYCRRCLVARDLAEELPF